MSRSVVRFKHFHDPDLGDFTIQHFTGEPRWMWLATMVKKHGFRLGVELGLNTGRTTKELLQMCPGLRMVGVEAFEEQPNNPGPQQYIGWGFERKLEKCKRMAERFKGRFMILKGYTYELAPAIKDGAFDFVFMDADHSYRATWRDIVDWRPKVRPGGLLCGHDYNWPTVRRAVEELCPGHEYKMSSDKVWWVWV